MSTAVSMGNSEVFFDPFPLRSGLSAEETNEGSERLVRRHLVEKEFRGGGESGRAIGARQDEIGGIGGIRRG